jgi:hypothetical protein
MPHDPFPALALKSQSKAGLSVIPLITQSILRSVIHSGGLALAMVVLGATSGLAKVGDWKSYTSYNSVNCLLDYQGRILAGTKGGIRSIDPATLAETHFDNLNGLLDVWITSLVMGSDGAQGNALWAISRDGFVHRFDGRRFTAYGQSYATERWQMNSRAAVSGGHYLALGSTKGLTFFDTRTQIAVASLNRFDQEVGEGIVALLRRGDTLYVSTPKSVYQAAIDWQDLLSVTKHGSIYDPRIWKQVSFARDSVRQNDSVPFVREFGHLVFENGRIESYGEGTVLPQPIRVEAFPSQELKIGSVTYQGVLGFGSAIQYGSDYFLGTNFGVFKAIPIPESDSVSLGLVVPGKSHPNDILYNIAAYQNKVYAHGYIGKYILTDDQFSMGDMPPLLSEELQTRSLRNLVAHPDGDAYIGTWGFGLQRIRNHQVQDIPGTDSCPKSFLAFPGFRVTHAISRPYKQDLWMGMFLSEDGANHQLVHFDINSEKYTCLETPGPGEAPHAIEVLDDTLLAVGSSSGVHLFNYLTRPTQITLKHSIASEGDVNDTWGVRRDAFDRIWFLQGGKLNYLDSLKSRSGLRQSPKPFDSFTGVECRALASDPALGLWAGCKNGIFRIVPAISIRDVRVTRFTIHDGLLSNSVYDVSVDPVTGVVWAATERGVSRYDGGIAFPKSSLGDLSVYPNPFRASHRHVIFDQLPPQSELRIHTQAGQSVRTFRPSELNGYQAHWDGRNDAGKPVAPGVYLYTVKAGSQVKKGRLIVAR